MKKLLLLLCCFPLLMATTCEDEDDVLHPIDNCSDEAVAGLNVVVRDVATNEVLSDGVTITAQDGTYSEILQPVDGSSPFTFAGAWDRGGSYVITVQKGGYATYVSAPIAVTANQCHVNPQHISMALSPN